MFLIIFIVPLVKRYVRPDPKAGLSPNNTQIPGGFLPIPTLWESSLWKFHLLSNTIPYRYRRSNPHAAQTDSPARRASPLAGDPCDGRSH